MKHLSILFCLLLFSCYSVRISKIKKYPGYYRVLLNFSTEYHITHKANRNVESVNFRCVTNNGTQKVPFLRTKQVLDQMFHENYKTIRVPITRVYPIKYIEYKKRDGFLLSFVSIALKREEIGKLVETCSLDKKKNIEVEIRNKRSTLATKKISNFDFEKAYSKLD